MTRPTRKELKAWKEHMNAATCPHRFYTTKDKRACVDCGFLQMRDDYRASLPEKDPPAPRARNEEREQERLTTMAAREWWWPYYVHHMQERSHKREAQRGLFKGVKPGWPDVTLIIPGKASPHRTPWGGRNIIGSRPPVLAALELKAEERRPKNPTEQWWLSPEVLTQHTMFGLTRNQAERLQILHGAGFATMVAYGAQEAFDWLSEQAGEKPSE